ncbi:MAG: hypothetical protein U9O20_03980 [Patescibacteria group bacterium]|nr:hypothetical protein [Patescibacteria group bacterium]
MSKIDIIKELIKRNMQTGDPKKEHVKDKFKILSKIWEGFVISITIAVFLTVLTVLGLKIYFLSESIFNLAVDCLDRKIEQEQMIYHADALKTLNNIQRDIWLIDEKIQKLEQREPLSIDEKTKLNRDLKKIEESSILLESSFDEYFDDISIQVYPRSNKQVTSFVYETRNFSLTLNRFVRTIEICLFLDEDFNEDQTALVLDNYYDVLWYIEQFGLLE